MPTVQAVDACGMCGILGVAATRRASPDIDVCDVIAMRDTMIARGPDDCGLLNRDGVMLAHRRLAIRDLQNGQQPWVAPNGECALVYNGEIYNDDELRKALRPLGFEFGTTCDTEVLMAAWLAWGPESVKRLRGMFAFGVYDFRTHDLYLVRDRSGVKPLFYAFVGGDFVFASTIRAIARHPRFTAKPNLAVIRHYLSTFRITLDNETVFDGIRSVRPAEMLRMSGDEVTLSRYWQLPAEVESDRTFDETVEDFQTELHRSVSLRLKSDVDVGMMMSGGVDSNTLAVLVDDASPGKLLGVCGGGDTGQPAPEGDFQFAQECAQNVGFEFQDVRLKQADYSEVWTKLIDEYATPVSTPSDAIIHSLSRKLKQHVGVALGGEGADEMLCGYSVPHWSGTDFDRSRQLDRLKPGVASQVRESLRQQYGRDTFLSPGAHYLDTNSLIPTRVQQQLFREESWPAASADLRMERYYNEFYNPDDPRTTAEKTAAMLQTVNLECLLSRLDSATMQASLEARVPYTDHVLVEKAFRTQHAHRIDVDPREPAPWLSSLELEARGSLRSKRMLRHVARKLLPERLANRPKASFPTPVSHWMSYEWSHEVHRELIASEFGREVFRPEALDQIGQLPPQLSMWKWPVINVIRWGQRWFG